MGKKQDQIKLRLIEQIIKRSKVKNVPMPKVVFNFGFIHWKQKNHHR